MTSHTDHSFLTLILGTVLCLLTAEVHAIDAESVLHGVPDPTIVAVGPNDYYLFSTGRGIPIWRSSDLIHWRYSGRVFDRPVPEWAALSVSGTKGIWAPHIAQVDRRFYLYYSASTFGSRHSVIGVATAETLDPQNPQYGWTDHGLVVESRLGDDTGFNAIDADLYVDRQDCCMFWGSYWTGIKATRIDRQSGKPVEPLTIISVAARAKSEGTTAIEAPYVIHRGDYYYMFVSYDFCCDGSRSTYKVMVGRSKNLLGPYADFHGRPMTEGGATLVLASHKRWRGPGHNSVLTTGDGMWLVHHVYDAENIEKGRVLQIRPIYWDAAGWPVTGEPLPLELKSEKGAVLYSTITAEVGSGKKMDNEEITSDQLVGIWRHSVDYGESEEIRFDSNGQIRSDQLAGRWLYNSQRLTLRWSDPEAPGGQWVDNVVVEPGGRSYIGRNQSGAIIRGVRP